MEQSEIFAGLEGYNVSELFRNIRTPAYVIDEGRLIENGRILKEIQDKTGCKILLAQKAFSNFNMYKTMAPYLAGTEASGLYEARLGAEEMPEGEVHVFCGAYRDEEFDEILRYADHIVFNSVSQLERLGGRAKAAGRSVGIRVNPEVSTQNGHDIYDPCASGSRLGVTLEQWKKHMTEELIELLDGIHFHTLCEQDSDALEITLDVVEKRFGAYFGRLSWINFGGGHHITRGDYNVDRLIGCIERTQKRYGITVYLEPGEACALNAGYMVTRVLDVVENDKKRVAILDSSAACHMPDIIEMPYMPPLYGAVASKDKSANEFFMCNGIENDYEKKYPYILAGPTCLAGDVIGVYNLRDELSKGDILIFGDMAIYTTCKNNTFNGMPLPDICCLRHNGEIDILAGFGYEDFKGRLGR